MRIFCPQLRARLQEPKAKQRDASKHAKQYLCICRQTKAAVLNSDQSERAAGKEQSVLNNRWPHSPNEKKMSCRYLLTDNDCKYARAAFLRNYNRRRRGCRASIRRTSRKPARLQTPYQVVVDRAQPVLKRGLYDDNSNYDQYSDEGQY
jgi:hypothetical protein